jgi:hypothetical protein
MLTRNHRDRASRRLARVTPASAPAAIYRSLPTIAADLRGEGRALRAMDLPWHPRASSFAERKVRTRIRRRFRLSAHRRQHPYYSAAATRQRRPFETLLTEDAVISDELNHASVVDTIRLCRRCGIAIRNNVP